MEPTSNKPRSNEEPEPYVKSFMEAVGNRLDHLLRHTSPCDSNRIDLYGTLLPTNGRSIAMWSTIEEAYPKLCVDEAHAEYMRKLDENQANHLAILATLPSSRPAVPEASKPLTCGDQLASLQARKPPVAPQAPPKPTDPLKVAAAQALVARQKAAREAKEAAAAQFFRQAQPLKLKSTTATKTRASTSPKQKRQPARQPTAAARRSTSPSIIRPPRPLAPTKETTRTKTPPTTTREENKQKKPSVPAMLREMLNLHKDVVLITPPRPQTFPVICTNSSQQSDLPTSMGPQLYCCTEPSPCPVLTSTSPQGQGKHPSSSPKKRSRERSVENNSTLAAGVEKQLAESAAAAAAAVTSQEVPEVPLSQPKRAKTQPSGHLSVECSIVDTLAALAVPLAALRASLDASSGPSRSPAAIDIAKAQDTARRMFKLSADRRAKSGGKDTHLSIMFLMNGGVELLSAATALESAEENNSNNNSKGASIEKSRKTATELYTAAAVALEECAARGKRAHGPELLVTMVRSFAERAGACARLRSAIASSNSSNFSTQVIDALRLLQSSAEVVAALSKKASEEGNVMASRAAAAMYLLSAEALSGRPEQLGALVLACKCSIMKL